MCIIITKLALKACLLTIKLLVRFGASFPSVLRNSLTEGIILNGGGTVPPSSK